MNWLRFPSREWIPLVIAVCATAIPSSLLPVAVSAVAFSESKLLSAPAHPRSYVDHWKPAYPYDA